MHPDHDPLIGTLELAKMLNRHPGSIYRDLRENENFPTPIKISANRLAWRLSVINAYIDARPIRQRKTAEAV